MACVLPSQWCVDRDLRKRLLRFAIEIGWVCEQLPESKLGSQISDQLVRSGTSPGPNYEEACAAESRRDFIHKMSISLKELRESDFWLRLIAEADLLKNPRLDSLLDECNQLCRIFGKSIITARRNDPKQKAWRIHP
jgi:four helix bundle protein